MHHAIGGLAILALVAFAFGERTARVVVGVGLLAGLELWWTSAAPSIGWPTAPT